MSRQPDKPIFRHGSRSIDTDDLVVVKPGFALPDNFRLPAGARPTGKGALLYLADGRVRFEPDGPLLDRVLAYLKSVAIKADGKFFDRQATETEDDE